MQGSCRLGSQLGVVVQDQAAEVWLLPMLAEAGRPLSWAVERERAGLVLQLWSLVLLLLLLSLRCL
jgi:hypothetical protein